MSDLFNAEFRALSRRWQLLITFQEVTEAVLKCDAPAEQKVAVLAEITSQITCEDDEKPMDSMNLLLGYLALDDPLPPAHFFHQYARRSDNADQN